jgi:hypothetical protein
MIVILISTAWRRPVEIMLAGDIYQCVSALALDAREAGLDAADTGAVLRFDELR